MAAAANEVIDPWVLESAKPCDRLRHSSAAALEMLGFVYDAKAGRWVIPPPKNYVPPVRPHYLPGLITVAQ
jgi:hypothetical protein